MEDKVFRLDGEYAAEWTPVGLKIFAYFTDDGIIRQDLGAWSVVLGELAQSEITAAICEGRGDCDMYNELAAERDELSKGLETERDALKAGLVTILERLRGTTQTLSNITVCEPMSDDARTILENEWANVLRIFADTNDLIGGANA